MGDSFVWGGGGGKERKEGRKERKKERRGRGRRGKAEDPENLAPNAPNLERGGKILPEEFAGVDWGNIFLSEVAWGGGRLELEAGRGFSGRQKKSFLSFAKGGQGALSPRTIHGSVRFFTSSANDLLVHEPN
jgi:hypothetical protein